MRFLKAFILSVLASSVTFVAGAVFLGIFNIYLAGHGIDWPNQEFETGPTGMSPLSTVLAMGVITTFILVFAIAFHGLRTEVEKDT